MSQSHDLKEEKRHWTNGALERLRILTNAALPLRAAFESGTPVDPDQRNQVTSPVLLASAATTQWLEAWRAPRGLRRAEAELGATAGVYRNAAVAFTSLADADPGQLAPRRAACLKLLDQGDHHVDLFYAIVRKKGLFP